MDINWYGQSCFKIKGKTASLVIDPFDPEFTGLKLPKDLEADVILSTHPHQDHNFLQAVSGNHLAVTGPGEYEISGVSITGIGTYHDAASGADKGINTVYQIVIDGINVVHLGDLGHLLTEEQVSQIDAADILMVPVGGSATIDSEIAAKVVAQLEPRVIIPMHYKIPGLKFELEDAGPFLKEMGAESMAPVPKLVITKDKLPEETTVVVLSKQG
jgi:L-ascorbate metabolism protein UlaG (beta-lactamase superfamily)